MEPHLADEHTHTRIVICTECTITKINYKTNWQGSTVAFYLFIIVSLSNSNRGKHVRAARLNREEAWCAALKCWSQWLWTRSSLVLPTLVASGESVHMRVVEQAVVPVAPGEGLQGGERERTLADHHKYTWFQLYKTLHRTWIPQH